MHDLRFQSLTLGMILRISEMKVVYPAKSSVYYPTTTITAGLSFAGVYFCLHYNA